MIELGIRPGVSVALSFDEVVSHLEAAAVDAAGAISDLAPARTTSRVALVVGLAAWCLVSRLRRRRAATRAVRRALEAPDLETRKAAVLVAAHHGLDRYARAFSQWVDEQTESVLEPLAVAACDPDRPCRGRRLQKLRRWAEEFFEARAVASRKRAQAAVIEVPAPAGECVREVLHALDALLVVGAVAPGEDTRPSPAGRAPAGARSRWRARPDELDALKVLEALGAPRRPRPRQVPAAAANGQNGTGQKLDLERLLDELAGVRSGRRPFDLSTQRVAVARPRVRPARAQTALPRGA